jgi:hypothetical protein
MVNEQIGSCTFIPCRVGLICRDVEAHCSVNHEYHLSLSTAYLDGALREKATVAANVQALGLRAQEMEGRRQEALRRRRTVHGYGGGAGR